MRVFVTGASGWIGSAVVPELIDAGHQVVGLARSDASADALTAAGAEVQRGTLDDLDSLRDAAAASDGVIHLAFKHDIAFSGDFQRRRRCRPARRRDVRRGARRLRSTVRHRLRARSALAPGRVATERDGHGLDPAMAAWAAVRRPGAPLPSWCSRSPSRGVRSSVVRLPPTNHGDGDNGFMRDPVGIAREKGVSGYVGDGANRWPAVHRLDSAHLFRLALEQAPAGSTLHAVADEGVPIREIAEVIGRHLDVPVRRRRARGRRRALHLARPAFSALDSPASSALTRELLGWQPTQPGLIADLDQGHYFRT